MLDRGSHPDGPTEPDARPTEQLSAGREDLRARLGRLPDCHPSAPDYGAADHRTLRASDHGAERAGRSEPAADIHDVRRPDQPELGRDAQGSRQPDQADSAWLAPDVHEHPERPDGDGIRLPADRTPHVVGGDGPGTPGGGHRHGTGRSGKTEFPERWTDDMIVSAVEQVARHPDAVELQSNGRWRATGERDGVRVTAVVRPDGRIWTAWPEPGGPGVRQNPKDGGA